MRSRCLVTMVARLETESNNSAIGRQPVPQEPHADVLSFCSGSLQDCHIKFLKEAKRNKVRPNCFFLFLSQIYGEDNRKLINIKKNLTLLLTNFKY